MAYSQQTPPKKNPTSSPEESSGSQSSSGQPAPVSSTGAKEDGDFGKTLTGKVVLNSDKAPERAKVMWDKRLPRIDSLNTK